MMEIFTGARAGTEAAFIRPLVGEATRERLPACYAVAQFGSLAPSPILEDDFVRKDWIDPGTAIVARNAGRDQIRRIVIPPVLVDMVRDEIVSHSVVVSDSPLYLLTAPVAWVRPRTNLLVKAKAMSGNDSTRRGNGMSRSAKHVVFPHDGSIRHRSHVL